MDTASVHSSLERKHKDGINETIFDDEKKAGSFYDNEHAASPNDFYDEDSPIEEVKIVVPK